jgi:hypothetical protein
MVNIHGHGIMIVPSDSGHGPKMVCPVHKSELEVFTYRARTVRRNIQSNRKMCLMEIHNARSSH